MSGTLEGGKKAAATNKNRYGNDWYATIGRKGGKKCTHKGFASMTPEKIKAAGRKGGLTSSRKPLLSLEERRREVEELLQQEKDLEAYEES